MGNAEGRTGGRQSNQATAASFERIAKALYDLHTNGQLLPKEFSQLQAATGRFIDTQHGADKFIRDTAGALKALAAIDRQKRISLLKVWALTMLPPHVMIQYGDAVGAYIDNL